MTIVVYFHHSSYRNFKHFYQEHILKHCQSEFPPLRFDENELENLPILVA
jgi:hypothetical protein